MIISHKYRYVFVQTMKTASTAIAAELCENYDGEKILWKHATIDNFRHQATRDERMYFAFAGVRNPLDVAVSRYELRKLGEGRPDQQSDLQADFIRKTGADFNQYFREFVVKRRDYAIGIVPTDWRSRSFRSLDYVYRYENIGSEFRRILDMIGIDMKRELPIVNRTAKKGSYLDYYDELTLASAYDVFYEYMQHWSYEIPERYRRAGWSRLFSQWVRFY